MRYDALRRLPADRRKRLIKALQCESLTAPYSAGAVRAATGLNDGVEDVVQALQDLERLGVSGPGVALLLEACEEAGSRGDLPDFVWSGPEVPGLHARDTRRVYDELLGSAQRSIWASTYVVWNGQKAFEVLARRMDAVPDLQVTLLLNVGRDYGDTTPADELVRIAAQRFWREWPGQRPPRVYYDPRALALPRSGGVLHAKAVVTDDTSVFITSANFTEAALDRNIELGLVLRDPALAGTIVAHFRGLIDKQLLAPLPPK